ncbi:MAG TPA: hypothetical protein VGD81_16915 [Opitutaceae bacterium]
MHSPEHKVIISGTGRSGTTFLVQLLTELGLDTGYTRESWRRSYFEHCAAGLERDLDDPASPYIVKNPALCETLPAILARGSVVIDHALVPVRALEEATRSRIRVGGDGSIPGGLLGTSDEARQKEVLAERFHQLMHTLTVHDIPHTLLLFPRFATEAGYAYEKLAFLRPGISRDEFRAAFARVARPELIHDFTRSSGPAETGAPARAFQRLHQRKRWRRRARRWLTGLSLAAAGAWMISSPASWSRIAPAAVSSVAPRENPIIARATWSFNRPARASRTADALYLSHGAGPWLVPPPDFGPPPGSFRSVRIAP